MTQTDHDASQEQQRAASAADDGAELVARPDPAYRWKHLIMAIVLIGLGGWFGYDGWINWPNQNARAAQLEAEKARAQEAATPDRAELERLSAALNKVEKHNDLSILLQKLLAVACPVMGLFWGAWTLRDTRGVYRMTGDALHVPGHPPVTLADIRRIDKRKWDRKGIAYLHYEQSAKTGVLKLDDFAYQRTPTDAMLDRIEKSLLAEPGETAQQSP